MPLNMCIRVIEALARTTALKTKGKKQMETRTRAGVVTLGGISPIVLSTLTLALAAPVTGGDIMNPAYRGSKEENGNDGWPRYRADAGYSGYTASQLPSDLSLVWKWEGKAPSGPDVIYTSRTCDVGEES